MASRALGAHRPDVVSRAATRGSSRRPFTRALFIPAPFCTCETFASERQRGKEREWAAREHRRARSRRAGAGRQERENRSHFSTKGKRARQQTPKLLAILYLAYDSTMIMRPFLIASRPWRDKNECSAMQIRFYASNYLECSRWITRGARKFIFAMRLRKNYTLCHSREIVALIWQ